LQALLDEVVQYRGKRDGEKGTELFQALLRETQESGEESPPAFRPTQNTTSNASSAQYRRRRSRKESSGPFSHPTTGTPPSVQSNTVAGNNRKGGSLQNISSHSQSEWGGVRRRKRHDTSDSETGLGSPRKREGGSLPCDVARGFKELDEPVSVRIGQIDNPLSKDCVINMEGVIEDDRRSTGIDYETEDRFPQPWNLHLKSSERSTAPVASSVEPMEQDMKYFQPSTNTIDESELTKKLLSKGSKETGLYGTMPFRNAEVDASIPFALDHTIVEHRSVQMNGTSADGNYSHRRAYRRNGGGGEPGMDENGNPFALGVNGASISLMPQFLQTRTSPPSVNSTNNAHSTASLRVPRGKAKKRGKDGDAVLSDDLPGHLGDRDVNELLQYIESSEGNGKKTGEKKNGTKNNGTLSKESSSKLKQKEKEKEKKSSKLARQIDSIRQGDSDDSDTVGEPISPPSLTTGSFRPATEVVDELETTPAAAADFQTVTKKQKRKKRNSLSNSITSSKKELFDQGHMNFFYNASSPSVMMRQSRHQTLNNASGSSSTGGGPGEIKKLVASVPPSEPSDVDSDGGDSVHSLPIQPSAPLFPSSSTTSSSTSSFASSSSSASSSASTSASVGVSYADIIRCEHNKSEVSFLAESSQPVDIKNLISSAATDALIPAAKFPAAPAANVPSNKLKSKAKLTDGEGNGASAPLRRAASLPPTSPSVDTPPVVIVGSNSNTQVDVTFGFELNEQLLALSIQPSPPQQEEQPLSLPNEPVALLEQVCSSLELVNNSAGFIATKPDFAARYRERPELLDPPKSRRSYEIVDFISQAWKRIERKLDEQHQGNNSAAGLPPQSSGIRVYTMD